MSIHKSIVTKSVALLVGALLSASAFAEHSWSTYHWARTANPMSLQVVDSVTSFWQDEFDIALVEWSQSEAFDMSVTSANDARKTRKRCKMEEGKMRVCNASYGFNGWLGLATIGIDGNGHIDKGTAQMNDSYSSYWADPFEKQHVMCQEIGHVFGLGHTSEDGSSQQTCMDYSQDSNSISPNSHDYKLLSDIYKHLDSYNSFVAASVGGGDSGGGGGGGGTKPCNPRKPGCTGSSPPGLNDQGRPAMGIRIQKNKFEEVWVASRADGGLWVYHIRLVPGAHNH
jgi:hypothetical protein